MICPFANRRPVAAGAASQPVPSCAAAAGTLEAVEVKNTCPFQAVSWVTAAGKRRSSYVVQDRGPRAEVRCDARWFRSAVRASDRLGTWLALFPLTVEQKLSHH